VSRTVGNTAGAKSDSADKSAATAAADSPDGNAAAPTNSQTATAMAATAMAATTITVSASEIQVQHPTDVSSAPTDPTTAAPGGNPAAGGLGGPSLPPAAAGNRTVAGLAAAAGTLVHATAALAGASASDKHTAGSGDSQLPGSPGDGTAAAQLNVGGTAGATDTTAPTMKVAAGVETPEFGQGLAERVTWMAGNNLNGAKLQVNPAQLGPIEVRIAVQGDHAQVWLTSHSAVTRDALESSSPKLREMLGAQGFGQVSVDISQRSFQERPAYAQPYDWSSAGNGGSATAAVHAASALPRTSSGAVDAYA
jgi:flagellar hook-length control protein FliK